MKIIERIATEDDIETLVEIRISAMRESLEAIGRFDPERAKNRFLESFNPNHTKLILRDDKVLGFYSVSRQKDHILLEHLYITPSSQGKGIGSLIIEKIKRFGKSNKLPIRLNALIKSRSNDFYLNHGFTKTHQTEWDNYYEFSVSL